MPSTLSLDDLQQSIRDGAAAFRARTRFQPAGGAGEKIFPPTFAGATYMIEHRRLPGREEPVPCVVLDTVQSQANRLEEALRLAWEANRISLPVVAVDFSDEDLIDPVGRITSLEAPHRIADAIFRDSELDGTSFRESEIAGGIDAASVTNATSLYRLCPTALVLGLWDSHGPKGGLGVKFERAYCSEIVGVGIPDPSSTKDQKSRGLRRDPLGVARNVLVTGDRENWEVSGDPKAKGTQRPSEIGHSNVPFDSDNAGVTIEYAEQTSVLSLIALRRLRFPLDDAPNPEVDDAGRAVLAALALCGATLASAKGFDLRSRCVLWPEAPVKWELLARPGQDPQEFTLDEEGAIALLGEAVTTAEKVGLTWQEEPVLLKPSSRLAELVRRSQEQEVQAGPEEA